MLHPSCARVGTHEAVSTATLASLPSPAFKSAHHRMDRETAEVVGDSGGNFAQGFEYPYNDSKLVPPTRLLFVDPRQLDLSNYD